MRNERGTNDPQKVRQGHAPGRTPSIPAPRVTLGIFDKRCEEVHDFAPWLYESYVSTHTFICKHEILEGTRRLRPRRGGIPTRSVLPLKNKRIFAARRALASFDRARPKGSLIVTLLRIAMTIDYFAPIAYPGKYKVFENIRYLRDGCE